MRKVPRCEPHLNEARFVCETCKTRRCDECVEHAWTGDRFADLCRACRSPVQRAPAVGAAPGPAGFLRRVPAILRYPVRPTVMATVLGLSLVTWFLSFAGLIGVVTSAGVTASVYFHMITRTAHGDEELDAPDFSDYYDHLIRPIGWMILIHLPLLFAAVQLFTDSYDEWFFLAVPGKIQSFRLDHLVSSAGPTILILIGLVLLPLLTAIAALMRSAVAIIDPRQWRHALSVMGSTYAVAAAAFYLVYLVEVFAWGWLLFQLQQRLVIPMLTSILVSFLGYVPMVLRARIIGALCEPYFDEL